MLLKRSPTPPPSSSPSRRYNYPECDLAGCGYNTASLEAMPVDRGNPRRFHRSTEWKKVMDDFFHGQLDRRPGQTAEFRDHPTGPLRDDDDGIVDDHHVPCR